MDCCAAIVIILHSLTSQASPFIKAQRNNSARLAANIWSKGIRAAYESGQPPDICILCIFKGNPKSTCV